MQRTMMRLLAFVLVGTALLPILILLIASGLSASDAKPTGIPLEALARWQMPDSEPLTDSLNAPLWASLIKTVFVAVTAALAASTISIVSAYLLTRRHSRASGPSAKLLALAAYGLPSVFLLIAFDPIRPQLNMSADMAIWLLHFLYVLPMASILAVAYAEAHPYLLDRAAAVDGASWRSRLKLAYGGGLWRGHLGIFVIAIFISWGDVAFSRQLLDGRSKLLADLYVLRYFENDSTTPDYPGAALFSLVLITIAIALALAVAASNRRGA